MLSDSCCIVKVLLFWFVLIQSNMSLLVWFILVICLHKSVNRMAKTQNWMSSLVPPGSNLNVNIEQSCSEGLWVFSQFTACQRFPTLSALFCKGNNVCSHFAFQISRFMSVNKLKYFFAVDTKYVMKKLIILMFPYTHQVIRRILHHHDQSVINLHANIQPALWERLNTLPTIPLRL